MSEDDFDFDGARAIDWRRVAAAVVAALAALALVILIAMVSLSNSQRDKAIAAQTHSFEVVILVHTLESTINLSEAALGRFVISGDKDVGRFYYDQWRRAGALIERLDDVTRDNPRQTALIASLRTIYRQRGEELAETAIRTHYGQGWNALSKYYQAGQAESLVQIADTLEAIIATEHRLLADRTGTASLSVERSNRLAWILSVFGVLVVIAALAMGWTTVQAIAQRRLARRDVADVARRASDLEQAVAERTVELREANENLRAEAAERAHAEAQLRQIQKMEAVGQLTGGIAHDFNNMLAVVIGGLELARRRIADGSADATRHIDNAMDGANRAATLTRRLLAYTRSEPLLPEALDPDALIAGMSEMIDRTLGERIAVAIDCADDGWRIWGDRHQLENALLNLAVNARDAMDGEGRLTISTANRSLRAGEIGEVEAGDYVCIAVSDDGCGMAPEVIARAFEPFFTTKPAGKGTGLGLSQIFGFVRQSRGEIDIRSVEGEETTVTLLLPRHAAAEPAAFIAARPAETMRAAPTGTHQILIVEDDPRVLVATVDALVELGHQPIACPDPREAAGLLARHPDIGLILSDVVMPGMSGTELIASLRAEHADVPVLFVTGFAGEIEEAGAFGGHDLLRKPFTIGALDRAVGDAIRKSRARTSGSSRFGAIVAAA